MSSQGSVAEMKSVQRTKLLNMRPAWMLLPQKMSTKDPCVNSEQGIKLLLFM